MLLSYLSNEYNICMQYFYNNISDKYNNEYYYDEKAVKNYYLIFMYKQNYPLK